MKAINRREFVKTSATAAAFAAVTGVKAISPNNKIVIGVMGLGGRGMNLLENFAKRKDTEIAYLCDPDTRRFGRAREVVEKAQERSPKMVQDFRRILEDKSVDVLINATPDHWHALGSIMACQAGKDVYVEKPMAHNIWEGRKMIEAARKYKRVVQVGTQSRSAPYIRDAKDYIKSGKLGEVQLVRVYNMMQHSPMRPASDQPVPAGFDYDIWCGPAAKQPHNPSQRWLNLFEYSCGPIPGDAVHQLDLARFLLEDPPCPDTVVQAGGINVLRDGRDTPDTQIAAYEYGKMTLLFEGALWTPYLKKTPLQERDKGHMPNWMFNSTRIEVLGTRGFMQVGRHGDGWQVFNSDSESVVSVPGLQADTEHQEDFLRCVRTREKSIADVEQGHYSVLLCHLANASFRVGNKKLTFDSKTETFPGCPEADRFSKRTYRAPWVVPENV